MMREQRSMVAFLALVAFATGDVCSSFAALQTTVVERHYDRFGRLAGISLNGERRTEIAYDDATGRIASMRVAGADEPFRWEYELGTDLKKTLRYPNGATVEWSYEPHRDLVTLVSNDVYSSCRYEYDEAGRRVAKNDERYEYNVRGELVLATNVVTGAEFAYRYDDIGNRQWSREFGTNCTYVANELNQYTNIVRGGVAERSAFDLDGDQTNVVTATGEWAVEYNGENRPVLWRRKSDGATIRMSYDRMGRRVLKNAETFVYDGYLNVSQTIWDPTEPIATRPLVWRSDKRNSFYFHDDNKSVVVLVDDLAAFCLRYAPFGRSLDLNGSPWQFSSEFADSDLCLASYNFRQYGPLNGRWLCRDRMDEPDGHLRTLDDLDAEELVANLYGMCENAPTDGIDILGNTSKRSGRYWQKKMRKIQDLARKADRRNQQNQEFWTDLMDFVFEGLDSREEDPRLEFMRTGSVMCRSDHGYGKCKACCVIMGRLDFGEILKVVNTSVMCKSCEDATKTGFLMSRDYFIQLAPMTVNHCGE
jgi:RHS repeat-associated protein